MEPLQPTSAAGDGKALGLTRNTTQPHATQRCPIYIAQHRAQRNKARNATQLSTHKCTNTRAHTCARARTRAHTGTHSPTLACAGASAQLAPAPIPHTHTHMCKDTHTHTHPSRRPPLCLPVSHRFFRACHVPATRRRCGRQASWRLTCSAPTCRNPHASSSRRKTRRPLEVELISWMLFFATSKLLVTNPLPFGKLMSPV